MTAIGDNAVQVLATLLMNDHRLKKSTSSDFIYEKKVLHTKNYFIPFVQARYFRQEF